MIIINEPDDGYDYEFTVVMPFDEDNTYLFEGHYTNGFEAQSHAISCGGIIIHDIRIAHKRKRGT